MVSGATGTVGRFVVNNLLEVGVEVRALMRSASVAYLPAAVEVMQGDLTDRSNVLTRLVAKSGA